MQKSEEMCRELLGERYHRLNPYLDRDLPMDSVASVPELQKVTYLTFSFVHTYSDTYTDVQARQSVIQWLAYNTQKHSLSIKLAMYYGLHETAEWICAQLYKPGSVF